MGDVYLKSAIKVVTSFPIVRQTLTKIYKRYMNIEPEARRSSSKIHFVSPVSCLVREWTIQFVFLGWFSKNIYKKNWDGRSCGLNIHIFPKAISSRSKMKRYRQYKTKSGWSGKYMRIKSISTLAQNWHQKSNKPTEARCTMRSTEKDFF